MDITSVQKKKKINLCGNEWLCFRLAANDFPSTFESTVRKILRLLFHVLAHLYHCHFREVVLLNLHAHLNCVFAHLTLFNSRFALIDPKETEILHDLVVALKIHNPDEEMAVDASVSMSASLSATTTCSTSTSAPATTAPAATAPAEAAQDSSQSASSSATTSASATPLPVQRRSSGSGSGSGSGSRGCEDSFLQCEVPLLKEPLLSHPETVSVGSVSLVQ